MFACSNKTRVRRDALERGIIEPIKKQLLDPERIQKMAAKLQKQFSDRRAELERRGGDAPRELAELDARPDRLRERLRKGDPDMEPDELQSAIDRVHAKRQQLAISLLPADGAAKVLAMLPRAAEIYCKQITEGINDNPEATGRAREILRELIGPVRIKTEGDEVWGVFELRHNVLLKAQIEMVGVTGFEHATYTSRSSSRNRVPRRVRPIFGETCRSASARNSPNFA
jgi:hypothetical protein